MFLVYDEKQCLPGNTNNLNLKLTGSYGTLQSPEYYPLQLYCEWLITVPEGKKVELSFERFDLNAATGMYGCSDDYLQINDGAYGESNAIHSFCGSVIPKPVRSSGRQMYIRFQAYSESDTPRRGFKATFKAVKEFRKLIMLNLGTYNTLECQLISTITKPPYMYSGPKPCNGVAV